MWWAIRPAGHILKKWTSLLAFIPISPHSGNIFFPFTSDMAFMSFTGINFGSWILIWNPLGEPFVLGGSLMEKPQRRAYDPGTGPEYADCLRELKLPAQGEDVHGFVTQHQYSLKNTNVTTCSSSPEPHCCYHKAHVSLPKHVWNHPVHIPAVNGRHWPKSKQKQKSSKTSFLSNITGLWMICLDSLRLEFFQTGLETKVTMNTATDWLEISKPTWKHMSKVGERRLAC